MLPGQSPAGDPLCVTCAGIPTDFHCPRCGQEAAPFWFGLCARCVLRDELAIALDDGTEHVSEPPLPLFDAISVQPNPVSAIIWLRKPVVQDLLHQLATGALPLTPESFSGHPHPRIAIHLRDLLIRHGVLMSINRDLIAYEDWLSTHLPTNPARR